MKKGLNEHEHINDHMRAREWMPLAAANALDDGEERELSAHLASCAECAAEFDGWRELGTAMRRIPTPQAPAALLQRVRVSLVTHSMAERGATLEPARDGVADFVCVDGDAGDVADFEIGEPGRGELAGCECSAYVVRVDWLTVLSWVGAAVAAGVLGLRHRQERRLA